MRIEDDPYWSDGKCEYTGRYYRDYCTCASHRRDRAHYNRENGTDFKYHFYSQFGDSDEESHYWEVPLNLDIYYELLSIYPPLSLEDLKKAYRKKALKVHPDKTGGDSSEFLKVKDAYDKLCETC